MALIKSFEFPELACQPGDAAQRPGVVPGDRVTMLLSGLPDAAENCL